MLADFAAEAVRFALIEPAKVVAWADGMIGAGDVPPAWLMDLSLVDQGDVEAMVSALREVPGESDEDVSLSLVSALVLREWRGGRLTIGRVRGIGWTMYQSEYERQDRSRWAWWWSVLETSLTAASSMKR